MSVPEPEITNDAVAEGLVLTGIGALPETEQEDELSRIGALIIERAFTKFLGEVEATEQAALEAFVRDYAEADDFIEHLMEAYPAFATMLDHELRAYRATLEQVFIAP
jgi:hypothetical protein